MLKLSQTPHAGESTAPKEPTPGAPAAAPGPAPDSKAETAPVPAPKAEVAKVDAPRIEVPKVTVPKIEVPKISVPKPETCSPEPASIGNPKAEAPRIGLAKPEAPKPEPARTEPSKAEGAKAEPAKPETSKGKAEAALLASFKAISSAGGAAAAGTQLGVAWIHGEFTVVAANRGTPSGSWISPEPVNDTAAFGAALRTAAAQTGFTGNQVTLVLAHARLSQRFIEVPLQKSAQSLKALERQVDQGKAFSGPARWVAQQTVPTKTSGGVIVHVAPVELVNELVTAAERAGLALSCIIPVTEVVRELVKNTGSAKDDTILLAAALPSCTQLVLVDGKGVPLLFRTVSESWQKDPGRVALDLNRTQQFVQQQFDRTVSAIWLHGADAEAKAREMSAQIQVPLRTFPKEGDPLFFANAASTASSGHALNLVTREQKQAPRRRVMVKFGAVVSALLLTGAIGVAGYVHYMERQGRELLVRLKKDEETLKARYTELQAAHEKLARRETFLKVIGDNRQSPVHAWFLGYLSESLPMELLVTNMVARVQTNRWHVVLNGQAQPALVQRGDRGFQAAFDKFTNTLAGGPIPLELHSGGPTAAAPVSAGSPTDWASRLKFAPAAPKTSGGLNFTLEGVLP